MRFYSIIIPVYNRPDEIKELLESLTKQAFTNFEVIIIEDGSTNTCDDIVNGYKDKLEISYYFKENSGQGFSRNYGFERAKGDYLCGDSPGPGAFLPGHPETVGQDALGAGNSH